MPDLTSSVGSLDIQTDSIALRNDTINLFKVGSTYYARRYDGSLLSSSTTAETVIAAALAEEGNLYFSNTNADVSGAETTTDWNLSGSFAGFTITGNTVLYGSPLVRIMVPNGFTGTAFTIDPVDEFMVDDTVGMQSINIGEQGTPARDWTGIKVQVDSANFFMQFCTFRDIKIFNPNIGLELESNNATSFINANTFDNILVYRPDAAGFLFDFNNGGISHNVFKNCQVQWLAGTTDNGFKDVDGENNQFQNCIVWDGEETLPEMNILSTASSTAIIGGRIGRTGVLIDQGVRTLTATDSLKGGPRSGYSINSDYGKIGNWYGIGTTTGDGMFSGNLNTITVGTGANSQAIDATGNHRLFDSGGTINSISGIRCNLLYARRLHNAYFKTAIQLNNNTNMRVYCGFVALASNPASSADPLNAQNGIALWLDTAVSANWKIMRNDGSGASTVADTSVAAATGTLYPVEIMAKNDNRYQVSFNGVIYNYTTDIPGSTSTQGFWLYIENTTGASRVIRGYYVTMRADV